MFESSDQRQAKGKFNEQVFRGEIVAQIPLKRVLPENAINNKIQNLREQDRFGTVEPADTYQKSEVDSSDKKH